MYPFWICFIHFIMCIEVSSMSSHGVKTHFLKIFISMKYNTLLKVTDLFERPGRQRDISSINSLPKYPKQL